MVSYAQNELLSITDFTKSISKILNGIKDETIEKIGVLKNNKLQAVVISTSEYERLKEQERILEEQEDEELLKIVEERISMPEAEYHSIEEVAKECGIDWDKL